MKRYIPGRRITKSSKQKEIDNQIMGFKAGIMAMAATMNDLLDDSVTEDMIRATCQGAMEMMRAIADGTVDSKYLNRELEKRTGIDIIGRGE